MNKDLEKLFYHVERALLDAARDLATLEHWAPELHDALLEKVAPYFALRNTVTGVPV